MKPEDMNQPNEYPLSDAGFKKLIADHQERPFYPNCYKCHHQSAIVGCSFRDDGSCEGTEYFIKRATESTTVAGYICSCPQGSICEFFDKEHETCRYGDV